MKYLALLSFFFLLNSCSESGRKVTIIFNSEGNILTGTAVTIKNMKIGTVSEVKLNKKLELCAIAYLDESYDIPEDSEFNLTSIPPFQRVIQITPGHASKSLKHGAWVHGIIEDDDPLNIMFKSLKNINKANDIIEEGLEEVEKDLDSVETSKNRKSHAK